jgi:hypothetical protein
VPSVCTFSTNTTSSSNSISSSFISGSVTAIGLVFNKLHEHARYLKNLPKAPTVACKKLTTEAAVAVVYQG